MGIPQSDTAEMTGEFQGVGGGHCTGRSRLHPLGGGVGEIGVKMLETEKNFLTLKTFCGHRGL